jgi:hypothetical protein
MPAYNRNIQLDPSDMDLIESALLDRVRMLSEARLGQVNGAAEQTDVQLRAAKALLGRLHNQKVFYRPRAGVYIGG